VAGLPQANNINGCDTAGELSSPANTAGNPAECRTFEAGSKRWGKITAEIDRRLSVALYDAGQSALGMPSSVDTFKAMLK
jgi:hypothetical protein